MNTDKPWWSDEYEELALEVIGVGSTSKKVRAFISKVESETIRIAQERVRGLKKYEPSNPNEWTSDIDSIATPAHNQALEDAITAINPK